MTYKNLLRPVVINSLLIYGLGVFAFFISQGGTAASSGGLSAQLSSARGFVSMSSVLVSSVFVFFGAIGVFLGEMRRQYAFNLRVLAAVIFSSAFFAFLFSQVLAAKNELDFLIRSIIFATAVPAGYLLIAISIEDVADYCRVKSLARKLKQANRQLRELDMAKSDFIAIASHQMRTPLTIIKGYLAMIKDGSFGRVPPKIQENLDIIYRANERMIGLIEEMLNVSHIESGKVAFNANPLDVNNFIKKIIKELEQKAKTNKVKIIFKPAQLRVIKLDKEKARHIIFNILDNAIKYSPQGTVFVRTKKHAREIEIEFTDTGIGLSRSDKSRLFDRFWRSESAKNIFPEGTGLGLYWVKKLLDLLQGRIEVESAGPGEGTTFRIFFPIDEASS